jgi:hypothetical protein
LIGYKPDEIGRIQEMILATDLASEPKTLVEKILCDADLDHLGRDDFFELDGRLREGRGIRGLDVSDDAKWYRGTLKILRMHKFYTQTQKKLREKGKKRNTDKILKILENIENQ